jgi:hypothetical protein
LPEVYFCGIIISSSSSSSSSSSGNGGSSSSSISYSSNTIGSNSTSSSNVNEGHIHYYTFKHMLDSPLIIIKPETGTYADNESSLTEHVLRIPMQDMEAGVVEWKEFVGVGAFLSVFSSRKAV